MEKIPFNSLDISLNEEIIEIEGTDILVRQYLPIDEKLSIIGRVIELAHGENNFANPLLEEALLAIETVDAYTNVEIPEDMPLRDVYDILVSSGALGTILAYIPQSEREILETGLKKSSKAYYNYHNSVYGIMENLRLQYSDLGDQVEKTQEALSNRENFELVRDILKKLG